MAESAPQTETRPYAGKSDEWVDGAYHAARQMTRIVSLRGYARECVEAQAFAYLDELKARGAKLDGSDPREADDA